MKKIFRLQIGVWPTHSFLTVLVISTNRAILSHGDLKPNFIKNEKKEKESPFPKRH